MLVTLACSAGAIIGLLAFGTRVDRVPVERYFPAENGLSVVFRKTMGDGSAGRNTDNFSRRPASDVVRDGSAFIVSSMVGALGLESGNAQSSLAALNQIDLIFARSVDEIVIGGVSVVTPSESIVLIQPHAVAILSERSPVIHLVYDPPLLTLRDDLRVGEALTTTGTVLFVAVTRTLPYTSVLTLEARESLQFEGASFDDCLRLHNAIQFGTVHIGSSRTWACAGTGVVKQEGFNPDGSLFSRAERVPISTLQMPQAVATTVTTSIATPTVAAAAVGTFAGPLTVTWKYDNADGVSSVIAPPIVVNEVIIVGTYPGEVIALDRTTGQMRWRFQTGGPVYGAPAVAEDARTIYIGSEDRSVYAVDARTGIFRWQFTTRDAVVASPAVSGGVVYVGSEDRTLYALDAYTGALLRTFMARGPIAVEPVVEPSTNTVYVGSDDGALYALDATDLTVKWAFAAGNAIAAAPVIDNNVVYVGSHDTTLYALSTMPRDMGGEVLWTTDLRYALVGQPVLRDGLLFAANDYDLYAIDPQTGDVVWKYSADNLYGRPVPVGGHLFIFTDDGVAQLERRTGKLRALFEASGASRHAGIGADEDTIFAGYYDGDIFAIESSDTLR